MASALPRTFIHYPLWRSSTIDDFSVTPRRNRMERATPSRRARSITNDKPMWKPLSRQIRDCYWDGGVDDLINNPNKNKITVFYDYRGNKNIVERTKNNKLFARISYYNNSVAELSFVTVIPPQTYIHTDEHGTVCYSTELVVCPLPLTPSSPVWGA